ncbi:MAG: Calx-beta domain-containing protein, partial [Verrucomicrobiales bacterium]|nr:Calx-beta domain-containing protein [Verrucomicrobiales bacterium]
MKRTTSSRRKRWFFARSMARAYQEWLERRTRSGKKPARKATQRPLFAEALEPRVLFSGTPVPVEDMETGQEDQGAAMAQTAELLDSSIDGIEAFSFDENEEINFTEADLERLASEAASRWEASGLTEDQIAALEEINYVVTDLEGSALAYAEGSSIYIDNDAAGYDWFVDETEWLDEEFVAYDGYLEAITDSAMEGIDLLTAIMHEQGHILGLEDEMDADEIDGLLAFKIGEGVRRLPESGAAEGATPFSLEGTQFLSAAPDFSGAVERYHQDSESGFEGFNTGPTSWSGSIAVVPSGTDGVPSLNGASHAVFTQTDEAGGLTGPFTRFDGYRSDLGGGIATEVSIYLDPSSLAAGEGFEFSVASNRDSGGHLRDFVFHVTKDTSSGELLVGSSNNANTVPYFHPREDLEAINHAAIGSAGWYTFEHIFYENSGGSLDVEMNVLDSGDNLIFTEVRNNQNDTEFGGNRYLWFTGIQVDKGIAIDQVSLRTIDSSPVQLFSGNSTSHHDSIQSAIDAASEGDRIEIAAGTYNESINLTKAVSLVGAGAGQTIITPLSGSGIEITGDLGTDATANIEGIEFKGSVDGSGIDFANTAILGTLNISNSKFEANFRNGVEIGGSGDLLDLDNVIITNSEFVGNGEPQPGGTKGDGDILLYQYNGDATISNVTITGQDRGNGPADNAIQLRSTGVMGAVNLTNVSIAGVYQKVGLAIYSFDNIDNLSASGVTVSADTGWNTPVNFDGIGGSVDVTGLGIAVSAASGEISIQGNAGANTLVSGEEGAFLRGHAGDDVFTGNGGDDTIIGDETDTPDSGIDTAVFKGNFADFEISPDGDTITISDLNAEDGDEGTDTLYGVEKLQFADVTISVASIGDLSDGPSVRQAVEDQVAANPGEPVAINGTSSNDTIVIDLTSGNWLPDRLIINGGAQGVGGMDTLVIIDTSGNAITYTPDTTTFGTGEIVIDGKTIEFSDFEPVDFDIIGGGVFTLNLPSGDDVIDITSGTLASAADAALILSGTTGGVAFEQAHVRGATEIVINTDAITDGTDSITVTSADGGHNNGALTINTGSDEGDSITVNGPIDFGAGTVTLTAPTLNLDADIVAGTIAGSVNTVNVTATGSIQDGIDLVSVGGTVNVAAGTYVEDITIGKTIDLRGDDATTTTVSGAIGGEGATVRIAASDVEVSGFTITREGNTVADWLNVNGVLNSAGGIAIQGQGVTNAMIHDNLITGNRTGIDVNNSNGHTIRNNVIDNNRTGLLFRNQTDNLLVTQNAITNNWTVGILFLDASGGTNSPVQSALNSSFNNNNISGNWYGQIVDRQEGGSLPAAGTTNLKDFSGNYFGTDSPVVSTSGSVEPGYADLIPQIFGGTATAPAPGTHPDILGAASANFDFNAYLTSGADTDVEATPGWGTYGFQGDFSELVVTADGAQTGGSGRIAEAIDAVNEGGKVIVMPGTYGSTTLDKNVDLVGAGDGADPLSNTIIDGTLTVTASGSHGDQLLISGIRVIKSGAGSGDLVNLAHGSDASFLTFQDFTAYGNGDTYGVNIRSEAHQSLEFDGVTLSGNKVGLRVATEAGVDGLTILNSVISDNSEGITVNAKKGATTSDEFTNVLIKDTAIEGNTRKGIYVEKLNEATFDNLTILNNGTDATNNGNTGIELNLKYADYANIAISNSIFDGSGRALKSATGSSALSVKARDNGSYGGGDEATLNGVTITGNTFLNGGGAEGATAIRLGEAGQGNAGPGGVIVSGNIFNDGSYETLFNNTTQEAFDTVAFVADNTIAGGTITSESGVWQTIEDAINGSVAGDTITIPAGTYDSFVLNKDVNIAGAGDGTDPLTNTIINGGIEISASGNPGDRITVSGVRLTGANDGISVTSGASHIELSDVTSDGNTRAGLNVAGTGHVDLVLDGVTLSNNNVGYRMGTADELDGLLIVDSFLTDNNQGMFVAADPTSTTNEDAFTNVTIRDTVVQGNAIKGFYFEKLDNALFDNVTILNNGIDGAYGYNGGIDINLKYGSFESIQITDSTFDGSGLATTNALGSAALAIKARDDGGYGGAKSATLTTVILTGNSFINGGGAEGGTAIRFGEAGKNNAGPSGVTITGNNFDSSFDTVVHNATGVSYSAATFVADNTLAAGPTITDDAGGVWYDLGAAVNAAAEGATLTLEAGTFHTDEQVVIDKDLTIVGAGASSTTVEAGFDTDQNGNGRGWFLVNSGIELNVEGMTFDGDGHKIWQAFRHLGTGSFDQVAFENIKYQTSGQPYAGTAIAAFGGVGPVDVTNSSFSEIGRIGVHYFGSGTTGTFSGNTYTGKGDGDWIDYALDIGAGAVATVSGNTISGNTGIADSDGSNSAGVLVSTFYGAGSDATIENNFITGNTIGVAVGFDGTDSSSVTVNDNDLSGNEYAISSTNPTVDASGNWYGTIVSDDVADLIAGNVLYTPFLADGADTDGDASNGFQGDQTNLIFAPAADGELVVSYNSMTGKVETRDGSGNLLSSTLLAGLTTLTFDGDSEDNVFTIDLAGDDSWIPAGGIFVNGNGEGANGDLLRLIGSGNEEIVYTPDAVDFGNGVLDLGSGKLITFTGLEPVDVDGALSFELSLPNGADDVLLTEGQLSGGGMEDAIVISGTSNLVPFEVAHVRNTGSITIDTTAVAGTDNIKVARIYNSHGNGDLTINTGTEDGDTVTIGYDEPGTSNDRVRIGGNLSITSANVVFANQFESTGGAGNEVVTIVTDNLEVGNTIATTNSDLSITQMTAGRTVGLGDSASGDLNLSSTELGRLSISGADSKIIIGDADTGAIEINDATLDRNMEITGASILVADFMNGTNRSVSLTATSGAVTSSDPGADLDIRSGSLVISSAAGVGTATNALDTQVIQFDAQTAAGDINVSNTGTNDLQIGDATGAFSGLTTAGGAITLSSESRILVRGNGVNANGGNISLFNAVSSGGLNGIELRSDVVTTGSGTISLTGLSTSGTAVELEDGVSLTSVNGDITINGTTTTGAIGVDARGETGGVIAASGAGDISITGSGNMGTLLVSGVEASGGVISIYGTGNSDDGVRIRRTDVITTGAGTITINGTSDGGATDQGVDIDLDGGEITTGSGAISISGVANNVGDDGIYFADGTISTNGNVTFIGTGGSHSNAEGVNINVGTKVDAGGVFTVTGTSAGGAGIYLNASDGGVASITGATITLDGTSTGDGAVGEDRGVDIRNTTITPTAGGNVSITGDSAAHNGVFFRNSDVTVADSGTLVIVGTTTGVEAGVMVESNSHLLSADGNLSMSGSATNGIGVNVIGGADLKVTGGGNILVTGTGGADPGDYGVYVSGNNSATFLTTTGDIVVTGTSQEGIFLHRSAEIHSTAGNITLAADQLEIDGNPVGEDIVEAFGGAIRIQGATDSSDIGLGAGATGDLLVDIGLINSLNPATALIIGSETGTGTVDVDALDLSDPAYDYGVEVIGGSVSVEDLNVGAANDLKVTARTGGITGVGGGNDLQAENVTLITLAGDIGVSGTGVVVDGATLTTLTAGNQFLTTVNGIAVSGINAAGATVTFESGEFELPTDNVINNSDAIVIEDGATLDADSAETVASVTVKNGGVLKGDGALTAAIYVESGGKFTPGETDAVGTISVTELQAGDGAYIFDVTDASTYDQINFTGDLDVASIGSLLFSNTASGYTPVANDEFVVILNDGTDVAVDDLFDGLSSGDQISPNFLGSGLEAYISYTGGDGNDVVITVKGPLAPVLTANDDTVVISLDPSDSTSLVTTVNGVVQSRRPAASVTDINIDALEGNDLVTIDYSNGDPLANITGSVNYEGNDDSDTLRFLGSGGEVATYTPSATTFGSGEVIITSGGDTSTINFTGLEPVEYDNFMTVTVATTGNDDALTISEGTGPSGDALVVGGTIDGGTLIETAVISNTINVIINTSTGTADGNDSVTINEVDNDHNVTNLTVITGESGNDVVTLAGNATFSGDVSIQSGDVSLDSGAGTAILTAANVTFAQQENSSIGVGDTTGGLHLSASELTDNLSISGTVTIGRTDSTLGGTPFRIGDLDLTGSGYDLTLLSGGRIHQTGSVVVDGSVRIEANTNDLGGTGYDNNNAAHTLTLNNPGASFELVTNENGGSANSILPGIITGIDGSVTVTHHSGGTLTTRDITATGSGNVVIDADDALSVTGVVDAGSGLIDLDANTDADGAQSIDMATTAALHTTNTTADAITLTVNDSGVGTGGSGSINLAGEMSTGAGGKVSVTAVSDSGNNQTYIFVSDLEVTNADIQLDASDWIRIIAGQTLELLGDGTFTANAALDASGNQGFNMQAGATISVANSTADAVKINVLGGTAGADLENVTVGDGGTITVDVDGTGTLQHRDGSTIDAVGNGEVNVILDAVGAITLSGTVNAGNGKINARANSDGSGNESLTVHSTASLNSTNTDNDAISLVTNTTGGTGSGNLSLSGNLNSAGGIAVSNLTGNGIPANQTNIFFSGNTDISLGAGKEITLDSEDMIRIFSGQTVTLTGGGKLVAEAGQDGTGSQGFDMQSGASIVTDSTLSDAVTITVLNANGGNAGITLGSITTGDGAGVDVDLNGAGTLRLSDDGVIASNGGAGDVAVNLDSEGSLHLEGVINTGGSKLLAIANSDGSGTEFLLLHDTVELISTNTDADAISLRANADGASDGRGDLTLAGIITSGGGVQASTLGGNGADSANLFVNDVTVTLGGATQQLVLNSEDYVRINTNQTLTMIGSGDLVVNAGQDGAGAQGFDMDPGSAIVTDSTSANAVDINVNHVLATGNAGANIANITTGSGATVDIDVDGEGPISQLAGTTIQAAGAGDVTVQVDGEAAVTLEGTILAGASTISVIANSDGDGVSNLLLNDAVLTTSNTGANAIHLAVNNAGIGTGSGDVLLSGNLTTGDGGTVAVSNLSNDGGGAANIIIDTTTFDVGSGLIDIDSHDLVRIDANETLTVNGQGRLHIAANLDGDGAQIFTMQSGAGIVSDSTDPDAVRIEVNTPTGGTGVANLADITVGNGGGITVINHQARIDTSTGTTLTATSGTVDLRGTDLALDGSVSAAGGVVTVSRSTTGTIGVFQGSTFGDMRIRQDELARITAQDLHIGDPDSADNNTALIRVDGADDSVGVAGVTYLHAQSDSDSDVEFRGSNVFNELHVDAADEIITVAGAVVSTASNDGTITIVAADAVIDATSSIDSGAGEVFIRPQDDTSTIGLGGGAGDLNLDDDELATLASSNKITIGTATTGSGAVDIDAVDLGTGDYDLEVIGGSISVEGLDTDDKNTTLTANTGDITNGGGTTSVTAAVVTLNAGAGAIGASGDAVVVDADAIATDTAAGSGNQFLEAVGNVTVNSFDAGAGAVEISAGEFDLANDDVVNDASSIVIEDSATLDADSSETLAAITVKLGGTLKGSNGVLNTTVTLEDDGILAPGDNGGGTLTLTNLILAGDYQFDRDGDLLNVTGMVTLSAGSDLVIDEIVAGVATLGSEILVIDNQGANAVAGIFGTYGQGDVITAGDGDEYTISYIGGDGNNVVLYAGAAETNVGFDSMTGTLTITDINTETADALEISYVGGANPYYEIKDPNVVLSTTGFSGGDITRPDAFTVRVDASLVTSINVVTENGTPGTVDTVNINSLPASLAGDLSVAAETINLNTATVTAGGDVTFTGGVNLGQDTVIEGNDITFDATIDGAQALTVNSTGTGVTSFNDAVGGTTKLTTLVTNADGSVNIGADIATTGAQTYNDAMVVTADVELSGVNVVVANTVDLQTFTLSMIATGAGNALQGAITGTGGLLLESSGGTITLEGASDYSGGTEVRQGTIAVKDSDAFGTGLVTVKNYYRTPIIDLIDGLDIENDFLFHNWGSVKQLRLVGAGSASAEISGNIEIAETGETNVQFITGENDTLTLSGDISGSGANRAINIAKDGSTTEAGSVTLSGNNTIGSIYLRDSGTTVRAESDTALGSNFIFDNDDTTLELAAGVNLAASSTITVNPTGGSKTIRLEDAGATTASINSNIVVDETGAGFVFDVIAGSGDTLTLGGEISGDGAIEFNSRGTVVVTEANSYTGGTRLWSGTLVVEDNLALGSGSVRLEDGYINPTLRLTDGINLANNIVIGTIGDGKSIELDDSGVSSATVSGTISLNENSGGARLAFRTGDSDSLTVAGPIVNTGGIETIGSGAVILTTASSYGGPTSVISGTLLVNADNSGATGLVSVESGGILGGTGTVGGDTTIQAGGSLEPGVDGTGTLSFAGDLTIADELEFEINGNTSADLVNVAGTVTLGADSILDVDALAGTPGNGNTITVIENAGALPVSGTFNGLLEGANVSDGTNDYVITYVGDDGNDVLLFAGAAETNVDLTGGVLTITDINSDSLDNLTISYNAGTGEYEITDASLNLTTTGFAAGEMTRPNANSVFVSGVVNSIVVVTANTGGDASDDIVSVDIDSLPANLTGNLTVNAETINLSSSVAADGNVLLNGDVVLGGATTIAAANATFTGKVDGAETLEVNSAGTTTFGGVVGGDTALTSLTTDADGTTSIGADITTTGNAVFGDSVNLAGDSVITANDVTFANTVNGAQALTVNSTGSGVTTFTAEVGGTTALSSLTTNSDGSLALAVDITATGDVSLNDVVTLGADVVIEGGNVTFGNTIDGAHALTVNSVGSGVTTFSGIVGGGTALTSLTTNADGTVSVAADVTTTGDQSYNDALALTADATLTAEDVIFANTVDLGANELILDVSGTDSIASAAISGAGGSLFKEGVGTLTITTAGTYSGATRLGEGLMIVQASGGLGTSGVTIRDSDSATTGDPVLQLSNGVNLANNFIISNTRDGKTIQVVDSGNASAEISGNIDIRESTLGDFKVITGAGDTLTLSGDIEGVGRITVLNNGNNTNVGTLVLSGENSLLLGGVILADSGTTVRAASNTALGAEMIFDSGSTTLEVAPNIIVAATTTITANANGGVKTISFAEAGTNTAEIAAAIINNEDLAENFDIITGTDDTLTISGDISGNQINIERNAAGDEGTVELSGNNTHSNTQIEVNSTVVVSSNTGLGALGTLGATNATINIVGGIDVQSDIDVSDNGTSKFLQVVGALGTTATVSGTITTSESNENHFNLAAPQNGSLTIDGKITGTGSVDAHTGGPVIFTNNTNDYSGVTRVTFGTLLINGDNSLATGEVKVTSGGNLGGTGTVGGLTTVSNNGDLLPGVGGVGTLTFENGVTFEAGSTFFVDVDGTAAGSADVIDIDGDLDISGATFNFSELVAADDAEYLIASYTGTLTGATFAAVSGIPTGYGVEIDTTDKTIKLVELAIVVTESGGSTDVTEGGTTDEVYVSLNAFPGSDVTVTVTPDIDIDLGAGKGVAVNLTFTSTNGTTPQLVTVTAFDDALIEGPHIASIDFTSAGLDTVEIDDIAVTDNDVAKWSLTQSGSPVTEGDDVTYTLSLDAPFDENETGTVQINLADGTGADKTNSADYEAFAAAVTTAVGAYSGPGSLAFDSGSGVITYTGGAGGTSMTDLVINLEATDDILVEGPEEFSVTISNANSITGGDVQLGMATTVTTTIIDNDTATWSITGGGNVNEGATGSYTISLDGILQTAENASVDITLGAPGDTADSDDYDTNTNFVNALHAAVSGRTDLSWDGMTLTYTGDGNAMADIVFSFDTEHDAVVEADETFDIVLSNATSTTGSDIVLSGTEAAVTTTIIDDDTAAVTIEDVSVSEDGTMTFTATLDNAVQDGFTVNVDFAAGTAAGGGVDFTSTTQLLTFTGGAGETQTFTVALKDDDIVEADENFTLTLS